MIRAEHIFKSFGEQQVLEDINFTFEAGKTNLIIGRSGAGKTVLLKILVGLYPPTSGIVWYDDVDFTALDKKRIRDIRMKVGMLFQGTALFDSMTIDERSDTYVIHLAHGFTPIHAEILGFGKNGTHPDQEFAEVMYKIILLQCSSNRA